MKILLSNDDGISANGINALAEILASEHEIYIAAPDRERSAASHSLTLKTPLEVIELQPKCGIRKRLAITGTPADCVKLAISTLLPPEEQPDLVISGINHGPNVGFDIMYSGTVNCAMEAATRGIPSIAVSLDGKEFESKNFVHIAEFINDFIKKIKDYKFPPKTLLNINFPACPKEEITGIELTQVGNNVFTDEYDSKGDNCYLLSGKRIRNLQDKNSDVTAVLQNKISITPLTFDWSKAEYIKDFEQAFLSEVTTTAV